MAVKVTYNSNWTKVIKGDWTEKGLLELTTDVHRRSKMLAPVLTRALVNSGVIESIPNGYRVKYGSPRVPYARKRHFENNKHPQTKYYLSKAGESVARGDKSKYFKDKI